MLVRVGELISSACLLSYLFRPTGEAPSNSVCHTQRHGQCEHGPG
jgi:hypothetical protein